MKKPWKLQLYWPPSLRIIDAFTGGGGGALAAPLWAMTWAKTRKRIWPTSGESSVCPRPLHRDMLPVVPHKMSDAMDLPPSPIVTAQHILQRRTPSQSHARITQTRAGAPAEFNPWANWMDMNPQPVELSLCQPPITPSQLPAGAFLSPSAVFLALFQSLKYC